MSLKIAVCEDDPTQAKNMKRLLSDWSGERGLAAVIRSYDGCKAFLTDWMQKMDFDLLLLDIDLGGGMNGMELARRIRRKDVRISKVIETGNLALDAILNSKISMARAKEIEVNVKVVLPPELSVADYDLCILLGNLLDNAIEGCESQKEGEKSFLRVYVGVLREQLYLSVVNSYGARIKKENGRYRSVKASHRGLGLLSIDSIAARYHGYVNRKNDESVFATEVLLPL